MNDERALLAAIRANPADDTVRLAYADWLDEHAGEAPCPACKGRGEHRYAGLGGMGKPCAGCGGVQLTTHSHRKGTGRVSDDRRARAEVIRVQVEYAQLHPHLVKHFKSAGVRCEQCERAERLSDLLLGKFRVLRQKPAPFAGDCPYRLANMAGYTGPMVEWDWHRGFVSEVRCPAVWWHAHGDTICAAHPVTRVVLTTWPPVDWARVTLATATTVHAIVCGRVVLAPSARAEDLLAARWPGVTFELPGGAQ